MDISEIYTAPKFKTNRQKQWDKFLNQTIFLDERQYDSTMKRLDALRIFCREGLLPFIKSHGYQWDTRHNCVNHLATMLFNEWPSDFVVQPLIRDTKKMITDFDYYCERGIPQEDWDWFWDKWGYLTDFYDDRQKNRYQIPSFVFHRLDLYNSQATEEYERDVFEDDDSQEEGTLNENLVYVKDKKSMY